MGARFAIWMDNVMPILNLEKIKMTSCLEWETIPPFEQLPFLKSLKLDVVARTATIPTNGENSERLARRLHHAGVPTHRAHLLVHRPTTTAKNPHKRISIFERLSRPEIPTAKRVVTDRRISVVTANTTSLPTGLPIPRKNDAEASSSGGRFTIRQRRKKNAEMQLSSNNSLSTHSIY
ncbi:hypothetical protein IEQ34_018680 [Dendrobium chrysotoxum]|uniref:R13L1/DRL21-like LRR repeat region domain-containing protein n=1 Tax=Dendrobium chrysotoxum TaxID=161865 RepID=A0AAV7G4Q2_DENCH|nr:hypothetical protein IEQ34_018680 [Dendrobium chrysotoxum]